MDIIIKLTKHAKDKALWFGITDEEIKRAISRGSKFKQTDGYLTVYTYVTVAYKKIGENTYKIKTVYIQGEKWKEKFAKNVVEK